MLLAFAACVLLMGFVARLAFDRWKVPDFIFLTAAGIVVGPAFFNALPPDLLEGVVAASVPFMALTVAFVMMEAGIHLEGGGRRATVLLVLAHTAIAVTITFVGAFLLMGAFGFSAMAATVVAAATLGPSAVVLASVAPKLGLRPQTKQALLVEGVVSNVIGFFVVFSVPGVGSAAGDLAMWLGAFSALALAAIVAAGAAFGWGLALRRLHPKEGVFIATLAVALVVYGVASGPLGGNGAIAAFVFGAMLRKTGGIARTRAPDADASAAAAADLGRFHSEASFLVRTFFFFYLGLIFVPGNLTPSTFLLAMLLVGLFYMARLPSAVLLKRAWNLPRSDVLTLEGSVARGLSDVLLILYGISSGLILAAEAGPIAAIAVVVLFGSLGLNAVIIVAAERVRAQERRAEAPPQPAPRLLG